MPGKSQCSGSTHLWCGIGQEWQKRFRGHFPRATAQRKQGFLENLGVFVTEQRKKRACGWGASDSNSPCAILTSCLLRRGSRVDVDLGGGGRPGNHERYCCSAGDAIVRIAQPTNE